MAISRAADTVHRVRRVALGVSGVPDAAQALAWRQALREALDDAWLPALGDAFDAVARQRRLGARTLRLPRLEVRVRLSDPHAAGEALRAAVEAALHDIGAQANVLHAPQQRTEDALRHFLLEGRLPWADDLEGDELASTIASLRALARAWFDRLQAEPLDAEPAWLDRRIACSEPALSRWASLIEFGREGNAPPTTADGGTGLDASVAAESPDRPLPTTAPPTAAGRVMWLRRRLAALRAGVEVEMEAHGMSADSTDAAVASDAPVVASQSPPTEPTAHRDGLRPVPSASHEPALAADSDRTDAAAASWLAHDAGLVLLHPYLPTLLGAIGALENETAAPPRLRPEALPRAAALLHWLATGRDRVYEFELTLGKLLLGVAPDAPLLLDPEAAMLTEAMRDEGRALLEAVIAHWAALGSTRVESLRLAFLQRDGLLSHGTAGWQLRVADEAYDLLLARLPWSIAIVRLPWMREPLQVQWGTG